MSKNNLKSSQKQSVVVKIGDTTYKRRRPKRKVGIKKIPIINTGPFVTGILATPSSFPGSGSASTFQNISPFQPRNIIAADPRSPIQPIYQPEAYDSLFPGPGLLLNRRPREFDLESDISDVTGASSYNSGFPEDFRSVASQVSESSRGLEMIEIPQRGMGSSINPPSIEEIRKTQLTPQQQIDLLYSQQFVNPTFNNNRFSSEENLRNYERGNPSSIIERRLSRREGFNLSPNFPIPEAGQPVFQDSDNGSIDFK